jgi:hypothetical protein
MAVGSNRQPLWVSDGARYERVDADASPDGAVVVRRHEMGAGELAAWGVDDDETTLEIPANTVVLLALALIRARYRGRRNAFAELQDFCKANDIPIRYARWT